jgi:hypothetical protein
MDAAKVVEVAARQGDLLAGDAIDESIRLAGLIQGTICV